MTIAPTFSAEQALAESAMCVRIGGVLEDFATFLYLHGHHEAAKAVEDAIMLAQGAAIDDPTDNTASEIERIWQ